MFDNFLIWLNYKLVKLNYYQTESHKIPIFQRQWPSKLLKWALVNCAAGTSELTSYESLYVSTDSSHCLKMMDSFQIFLSLHQKTSAKINEVSLNPVHVCNLQVISFMPARPMHRKLSFKTSGQILLNFFKVLLYGAINECQQKAMALSCIIVSTSVILFCIYAFITFCHSE